MEIIYSPKFAREYKKLSVSVKGAAEKKEVIFRNNPMDPGLKTHRLHGKLKEYYSFSISYKYRTVFKFESGRVVYFLSVGDHDVYQ